MIVQMLLGRFLQQPCAPWKAHMSLHGRIHGELRRNLMGKQYCSEPYKKRASYWPDFFITRSESLHRLQGIQQNLVLLVGADGNAQKLGNAWRFKMPHDNALLP